MPVATTVAGDRAGLRHLGKEPVAWRFCSGEHFLCPLSPSPAKGQGAADDQGAVQGELGSPPLHGSLLLLQGHGPGVFVFGSLLFPPFLAARVSMMALKNCARSRRPGLFLTWSRETRFAKRRKILSGRPMGPFCTGEPSACTSQPCALHCPCCVSALCFFEKTRRGVWMWVTEPVPWALLWGQTGASFRGTLRSALG